MKSLYSGVAGLKTHNQRMDVIGNNIANVNTTAFKGSTVTFKDVFYQSKSTASSGSITAGGRNANQVGYGSSLATIGQNMTQSGFTYSDSVLDCAIEGEGFFQVMDQNGNTFYTRAGVFKIDNVGNLTDANGNIVLGVSGDPTGVKASSQRINLYVPSVTNKVASATKTVNGYDVTISASAYGTDGNIAFAIVDSDTPFATMNGSTLTVEMDLSAEYATAQDFEDAFNGAIAAGGVTLPDGVLPINFDFASFPPTTSAVASSNTMSIGSTAGSPIATFTAYQAGEAGNAIEVDMTSSTSATEVSARWNDDVLTITVPATGIVTQAQIQNAVNKAAGMTESVVGSGNYDTGGSDSLRVNVTLTANITDYDTLTGGTTLRSGLTGGQDNFFADVAGSLGTVKLTDGRLASSQSTQDLESIFIDDGGVIYGVHSVHGTIALGRIDIVTFENPAGLLQTGTSYWTESLSSGEAQVKEAGTSGAGSVVSGALEMSNVDLSQEFSDMIVTQRGFQANSRIITVSDTMLEELVNLKR